MNLFSKRPLLLALLIFISTSFAASAANYTVRSICLVAATVFTVILGVLTLIIGFVKRSFLYNLSTALLCSLFCTAALFSSHIFFDKTLAAAEAYSGSSKIVAEIEECTYRATYTSVYTARALEIDGKDVDFKISLSSNGPSEFQNGDVISASAVFVEFSEDNYGFNERESNIAKGIFASAEFDEAKKIGTAEATFLKFFGTVRDAIAKRIDSSELDSSAPLLKALLLGDKDDLPAGTTLSYRRLGISHILSISGTHFTILLGTFALFLSLIGLNKKVVYIILIPLAFFYMGLTGFSASVCRAGIMAILAYAGFLLGRMKDSYTALAISVTLILLISPEAVYSTSLWLSFLATFTVLILAELFGGFQKLTNKSLIGKLVFFLIFTPVLSVYISIVTLPIVAAQFGEISVISPIGNLIVVPLITLLLYIAPFSVILPDFAPLANLCDGIYELSEKVCEYISGFDDLLISLEHSFVLPIAIICGIATIVLIALPLKRRIFVLLPGAVCIVALAVGIGIFNHIHYSQTDITYFTSGENDGFVITDHNNSLCIDISTGASAPTYKAEYLSSQNYCPEIDAFLFTHYHNKHINMFSKLCSRTYVKSVYLPISNNETTVGNMNSIAAVAAEKGIDIVWFEYNEPTEFEGCEITVFEPIYISRSTHPVINLKISSNDTDVLYLGSSFAETDFAYDHLAQQAEYIVFGQHSPVAKKEYAVESDAFVIYGDFDRFALSKNTNASITLEDDGMYEITIK